MSGSTSICSILIRSSPGKEKYLISLRVRRWGRTAKPRITPACTHTHRVRSSLLPAEKTKRSKWLDSPRATAATVKRTNRFLLRKPLTLLLLMELILSFMLLAFFSITRCSRLLKSPFSGEGGLSTSSFRKRLVLAGGFSFIINSSTWSRRQVSWETRSGEDNREREDLSRL